MLSTVCCSIKLYKVSFSCLRVLQIKTQRGHSTNNMIYLLHVDMLYVYIIFFKPQQLILMFTSAISSIQKRRKINLPLFIHTTFYRETTEGPDQLSHCLVWELHCFWPYRGFWEQLRRLSVSFYLPLTPHITRISFANPPALWLPLSTLLMYSLPSCCLSKHTGASASHHQSLQQLLPQGGQITEHTAAPTSTWTHRGPSRHQQYTDHTIQTITAHLLCKFLKSSEAFFVFLLHAMLMLTHISDLIISVYYLD